MTEEQTVPVRDLMAVKAQAERLAEEKAKLETRIEELELQTTLSGGGEPSEEAIKLTENRKKLFNQQRELRERTSVLEKKEQELLEKSRKEQARELAGKYGVDESELLKAKDDKEMELIALRKALEARPSTPASNKYERGVPSSPHLSPRDMPDKDWQEYLARLKREAQSKK